MKQPSAICTLLAVGLCLLALSLPLAAESDDSASVLPTNLVTPDVLESKIAEAEAGTALTDEVKTKLVELYRKALSNLQTASANEKGAEAFRQSIEIVPVQTEALADELDESNIPPPLQTVTADMSIALPEIEQLLAKEQADLAAVDARRADFERRLTYEQNRPPAISQRLVQARSEQEEVASAIKAPSAEDAEPTLTQASRWELYSRYAALSSEIKMLDQELLSQPVRLNLLEAKRNKEVASVAWIGARVTALSELVNRKRRLEAEQSKTEAEAQRRESEGLDPIFVRLADQNTALTDDLNARAAELDALDRQQAEAEKLAQRIAADYQDIEATVETGGLAEGLGRLLAKHRKSLPDYKVYARKGQARERRIAEVGVQRLNYREESRRIADLDQTVAELESEITTEKTPQLRQQLRDLVTQRQELLQKALEAGEFYLKQLRELDVAERELLNAVRTFDSFLSEHLLWLRSSDPTRLADLIGLPEEARKLLSPATWSDIAGQFQHQITHSASFWLSLAVALLLLWKHRGLIEAVEATSKRLGKPTTDSFAFTLRALGLTLLIAVPLPLLFAAAGWQLQVAEQGTDLSHAVGTTLQRVALQLFVLQALHALCIPRGVAAAHFRWPESSLRLLRIELVRLTWIFVPAVIVVRLAIDLDPSEVGGVVAKLGFLVGYAAMTLYLYRVFHPKRGILAHLRRHQENGLLIRSDRLWFPLLVIYPPALVVLALSGYTYSAAALSFKFQYTLWLIAGLILLHALAVRGLLIVRRRLVYEAAVERRQAAHAEKQAAESATEGGEEGGLQFEEPEVDLAALSDDSLELVNIAIVTAGLVGFYLIWSSMFPALRIFDDIDLWYQTVTVAGEDKRLPITLGDLGLALVYAIGIGLLAKRLPAVLEIILLQRFDMSAASRYTVTALVNYTIVVAGILLVFNTIGAQWSQLQWLAAALSVGIGFGLQEIVANFISGLIILFERPIRVGDFVTVGDTDGVATKIRIRATTIRNMDGKELLVPNKEFITGRLLNWSLSDQTTRIIISVGIAYGSNVRQAMRLLEEVAREHEGVREDPAPSVIFEAFGDNSLAMSLRCFVDSADLRYPTISALNAAINEKFDQAGIVIAFPQRDLHLDSSEPLRVRIEEFQQGNPGVGNEGKIGERP